MMDARALIAAAFETFPVEACLDLIGRLETFDRYQASRGIEGAAGVLAEAAESVGLADVTISRFPVDSGLRWWTFQAPRPWTPVRAVLKTGDSNELLSTYPEQACAIAAHSASTPPGGVTGRVIDLATRVEEHELRDAIVLLNEGQLLSHWLSRASAAGAAGLVAGPHGEPAEESAISRLELPQDTAMFGFSVSDSAMRRLRAIAADGGTATAVVEVEASGVMPLVTATLEGDDPEHELLLQAHLCHPRPGANDNASGVAALVGIGEALIRLQRGLRRRRTVRFLWGPEFVATAAYLHDVVGRNLAPLPSWVINLDMIGENQHLCGGALIVERSADHVPSFLPALAQYCLANLPDAVSSWSGAVDSAPWRWVEGPFTGASDHLLFADPLFAVPTLEFGHWPDRFNHSSADTIDKVDANEVRRVGTVVASMAALLSLAGEAERAWLTSIAEAWGVRRLADIVGAQVRDRPAGDGLTDPLETEETNFRVEHVRSTVLAALTAAQSFDRPPASPPEPTPAHTRVRRLAETLLDSRPEKHLPRAREELGDPSVVLRTWPGPFNLRALMAAADPADRGWLAEHLGERSTYAKLIALAFSIDGRSSLKDIIRRAALSCELPIDDTFGRRFLEILVKSGWCEMGTWHGRSG